MARKRLTREESQQQTRERLLDTAAEVFSRRGFYSASVEEVAETAGYSKGAVYANFASKDELFLSLLDRRLQQESENWKQVNREQQDFLAVILADRVWNILLLEFFLYAMREEQARDKLALLYRNTSSRLAHLLQQQFEATDTPPPLPVEQLARVFFALGHGLAMQTYIDTEAIPPRLYEQSITLLFQAHAQDSDHT